MSNYFRVKARTKLSDMAVNTQICESDYAINADGEFIQFEYVETDQDVKDCDVNPGIYVINKNMYGMYLQSASFSSDRMLDDLCSVDDITSKVDCFFSKFEVYRELGIEIPKRGCLLYGPAGTGKSTMISKVCRKYVEDNKTAVVIWPTDKFEAHDVKDFVKSFKYSNGVEKLIFVVEDVGGTEISEVRMRSDSSLLSLLDNKDKTFTIPVLILATTNFPEVFMGNLTDRPDRFDDKLEIPTPPGEEREKLLRFFLNMLKGGVATDEDIRLITSNKTQDFSIAHVREVVLRSRLYDKTITKCILEIANEIDTYKKAFSKRKEMGSFGREDYDD